MKRIVTAAVAVCLAMLGTVLLAGPASAHHVAVGAAVVCGDAPGTWDVTWTVTNWNDPAPANAAQVVSATRDAVPSGTVFAPGQEREFHESVSSTTALSLRVSIRWANGQTASASGATSGFPACVPALVDATPAAPSVTPATCDADGTLVVPADTPEVRYTQTPAGTGPGSYTVTATATPGHRLVGASSWTPTVPARTTGAACLVDVTPVAPTVVAVGDCDTTGSVTTAVTTGVRYVLTRGDGITGPWEVTASAEPGYVLTPATPAVFSGDLGRSVACETGDEENPAVSVPEVKPPTPEGSVATPAAATAPPVAAPAATTLPATGADASLRALTAAGLGLLLLGAALLVTARRRTRRVSAS